MQRGGMIYLKYLSISDLQGLMSVQLLAVCACIRFATSQTQVMSGRFSGSGLMHILTNCRSQEKKITCKESQQSCQVVFVHSQIQFEKTDNNQPSTATLHKHTLSALSQHIPHTVLCKHVCNTIYFFNTFYIIIRRKI